MAKNADVGKCVHCLKEPVELTSDHMFPKAWYPDATPANLEKRQIPSCAECNNGYSKIEGDMLNRVALTLDAKHPASAGLVDAAIRAMNPVPVGTKKTPLPARRNAKESLAALSKGIRYPMTP